MSWAVDTPIRVGGYALAAIVELRVSIHAAGRVMSGDGEKRPLLFLVLQDDTASGIDVSGHRYEAEEIEVLFPRAIERMSALLSAEVS